MEQIAQLFQTRDQSVRTNDEKLFLSTQLGELPNGGTSGYLANQLTTEVLTACPATHADETQVVFVKEIYSNHYAFLLYYLVRTIKGWKIFKMAS